MGKLICAYNFCFLSYKMELSFGPDLYFVWERFLWWIPSVMQSKIWVFWLVLREARSAAIFRTIEPWHALLTAKKKKCLVVGFKSFFPCSRESWRVDTDQAWNFHVNLWMRHSTHNFHILVCSAICTSALLWLTLIYVPNSWQETEGPFHRNMFVSDQILISVRPTSPLNTGLLYLVSLSTITTLESWLLLPSFLPPPPVSLLRSTCYFLTHNVVTSLEFIVFKESFISLGYC